MKRIVQLSVGLLLAAGLVGGASTADQAGKPAMVTYDLADALTHGPWWAMAETGDGAVLVGADQVLEYNGTEWKRINIPGGQTVRGLARVRERIYVGATGEIGYLQRDPAGAWQYHSLRPDLAASDLSLPKEIWTVHATQAGVIFAGSNQLLRYDGKSFQGWILPGNPRLQTFPVGNELWFYRRGVGVQNLGPDGPETIWDENDLPESPVVWALAPEASTGSDTREGLLLGTSDSVFVRRAGRWVRLEELSAGIQGRLAVAAVSLPNHRFAVATYLNGVVIASRDGTVESVVNHAHGLPDDHVHSLWRNENGALWVGLNDGAVRLRADGRETVFDSMNGLEDGPVRKVLIAGGATWVTTAKSVYVLQPRTKGTAAASLARAPGVESLFWDAAVMGNDFFVAGFGGIWRRDGKTWIPEYRVSADVFRLLPAPGGKPWLIFTEQELLKALEYKSSGLPNAGSESGWVPRNLAQSVDQTPLSLVTDAEGSIWISTVTGEIRQYKPALTPGRGGLSLTAVLRAGQGLPEGTTRPLLVPLGSELFAFTETQILRRNPVRGVFEPEPLFADFLGLAADRNCWLVQNRTIGPLSSPVPIIVARDPEGRLTFRPVAIHGAGMVGRIGSVSLTQGGDREVAWLGGTKGLLRLDGLDGAPPRLPSPVRMLQVEVDGDALAWAQAEPKRQTLPGRARLIRFRFASPDNPEEPRYYQTWLEGAEGTWTAPQRETGRDYAGLAAGEYVLHVRALDAWGRAGPELRRAFLIVAPWWRQWPALAAYAVFLLLAGLGGARWRIRRLQRQNERLNTLVDERTRELALRSKELEMSNTAKSEFLENISHEIRNPLNGIRGFVTMIREGALTPAQKELAASLAACSGALTRVFDEVLGFAKIESGQLPVQRRGFSLPAAVDEVVALHRVMARQRGCDLRILWDGFEGDDPPRRFIGDGDRVRTILGNFLGNAIKYAPGQPVLITVECELDGARAANLTLSVRDHGPGVPAAEQELIFRKFVRGSNAKDGRVPGTGLGLATCRVLAEQMGGFVGMESPPAEGGPGTLFFLKLWLRRDLAPGDTPQPPEENAPATGQRALIVEDQDYNQVITLRVVQRLGFDAEVAQDGAEAQQKLATGPFAALFVDWEMPGLKGDEIARQVRALPWGENAIIIATTGHDSEAIKASCLAAGMDAFVLKPFDEQVLAQALDQARARRNQSAPASLEASGLDIRPFAMIGQGDAAKTTRAAADYLLSLRQELVQLDHWLERCDWPAVASTAHRLRSHAGIVAAHGLRESARQLQELANAAQPDGCRTARDAVWREADSVRLQLAMATGAQIDPGPSAASPGIRNGTPAAPS